MQVTTKTGVDPSKRGLGKHLVRPGFIAAALLTCIVANPAFAAPEQLAQLMSPVQDMKHGSGTAQAQRVAPQSGTSRAGLADQMGSSGGTQYSDRTVRTRTTATARGMPRDREQQNFTRASASRRTEPQDVNAISEFNRTQGAVLVSSRSGIREVSQLRGTTICFPNPADQAEAAKFLGGRAVSFTALTSDGPPSFLVESFNRGDCQAIYMSRQTQQSMANVSVPDAIVLNR